MNMSEDVDGSLAIMLDKDLNTVRGTSSKENWNMVIRRKTSSNVSVSSQSNSSNDLLCSNSFDAFLKDTSKDGIVMAPTLHISNPEVNKIIQECEAAMTLKSNLAIKPPIVTLNTLAHKVPIQSLESFGKLQVEFGQLILSKGNDKDLMKGLEGEIRVILTKRSMKLSTHPGEVALPGGKMDEEDLDDSVTALREAKEEIGLKSSLVQVITNLEPFISLHLLTVVPVVGLLSRIEEFKPLLNADEVDAIFDVPLDIFLKEENHRRVEKEWGRWKYVCHIFEYESSKKGVYQIGGLTASILIHAASIIYQTTPSFSECLPDFSQLQFTLNMN
ncbi:hypothetical protein MTR67_038426 [Solanum verrucosum]|uniref:Nudix hydrolase domain-containing protein n=1 Tax=Solanum verrucosum TaxID=315347 RepID=A0AAF0UGH3_SOLVR|nr:hypothetical protein MTR67_038426 [Solanum verrucosum]